MQFGSDAATQQFPRLLQLVELYPETMDAFKKKVGGSARDSHYYNSSLYSFCRSSSCFHRLLQVRSFTCSATSPSFAYKSNSAPDSPLCRAAAPQLRPLQLLLPDCIRSASTAAPRLRPLQLLLPDYVHFSCCLPLASTSAAAAPRLCPLQLLPDCVRFNCSPIASTSAGAPRLRLLQLLLSDCIRFNCCSPIASASTAAPRLHPVVAPAVLEDSSPCPMFSNVLHGVQGSVNGVKYEGRMSLV